MELTLMLCLPRDAETAHVTREVLDAALKVLGCTAGTRSDIALAIGEACANVIQHAHPGDEYEVRIHIIDRRCVIEVVDTGRGFDAIALEQAAQSPEATAEHGRGLQIINALADDLQIANRRVQGAIVRFEIPLKWEAESAGGHLITDVGTVV
ncbi:ATP-binding protein [Actinomadura opuntiae]|uniref:ATP-binding protein n=1 Tax=Actinomadura sp. OS1-43 TaxID=604315 RepID=UPI00255AAB78|nr:ATP-binding protein [Actinomadura sp. OS1-43]MDL4815405.1 ATP-binding protein [Actinomadura sp. OS1-43]